MASSESMVCDICGDNHDAECCPELGLGESFMEQEVSRARRSVPNNLCLVEYPDQSLDVVAKAVIPTKTRFGPFEAKECVGGESESDGIFYLKVFHKDGSVVLLDATCEDDCNWLSLIRVAQSSSEQNCIAYQMGKSIFFSSTKQIEIDEVLRVWYAPYYAQKMAKSSQPDGATKSMLQAMTEKLALEDNVMVTEQIVLIEDGQADVPQTFGVAIETNVEGDLTMQLDSNNLDSGSIMYATLDMVERGNNHKKEAHDTNGQAEIRSALPLNAGSSEMPILIADYGTITEMNSGDGNVIMLENKSDFNEKYDKCLEERGHGSRLRQIDKIITDDSLSFHCSKCASAFACLDDLTLHLCEHISSDMVKSSSIVCSDCGESFKNNMLLHKHIKSKHGLHGGVHKCSECDFVTMRAGFLKAHMRSHELKVGSVESIALDEISADMACEDSTNIAEENPASLTNQIIDDSVKENEDVETKRGLKRKTSSSVSLCQKVSEMASPGTEVSGKRHANVRTMDGDNGLKDKSTADCDLNTNMHDSLPRKTRSRTMKKAIPVMPEAPSLVAVPDSLLEPWVSPSRHLPARRNRGNRLRETLDAAQIGCRTRTIKTEPLSPVADEMKAFTFVDKVANAESQNLPSVPRKRGRQRKVTCSESEVVPLTSKKTHPKVIKGKDKSSKADLTPDISDKPGDDLNEEISEQQAEDLPDKSSESLGRSMRKSRGVNKKYNSEYVIMTKSSSNIIASDVEADENDDDDMSDDCDEEAYNEEADEYKPDDDEKADDDGDDDEKADDDGDDDEEAADEEADDDEAGDNDDEEAADEMQGSLLTDSKDATNENTEFNSDIAEISKDDSGEDIFTCKVCAISFGKYASLSEHYVVHTDKFHCQICDKTYVRRGSILDHNCDGIVTCQGDTGFLYKCLECDETFDDGKQAKVHPVTHVGKYQCGACGKTFRRLYKLEIHVCASSAKEEKKTDSPTTFVCEICGTVFDRLARLNRHMTMHTEIYKCNACDKTFARKESWQRHILKCSPEQAENAGVHSCTNCGKGFSTLIGRDSHALRCKSSYKLCKFCSKPLAGNSEMIEDLVELCSCPRTSSKDRLRFQCSLCSRAFMTEKSLERHVADHADAFVCSVCTKSFSRKDDCDWHALQCDAKVKIKECGFVECNECKVQYRTAAAYRDHCLTHSNPFQCNICQKRFRKQSSVQFHSCRAKSEEPVTCDICGRSFQHDRVLEMHLQTHGSPSYSCNLCHRKFYQERFVRDHNCSEEAIGDRTPSHICDTCGRGFSTRSNLFKHKVKHTDQRPMCDLCNKPFHSRSYLKEHIASVHENKYSYMCVLCDKAFKLRTGLQAHTKQFHDPTSQRYDCVKCGKTFRQRGHLKHHMYSHSLSRQFHCLYCTKVFRYPDQVNRHQLEHTVKDRLKCDFCEKTFIKSYRLRRHIEQSHSGKAYICSICNTRCSFKHTLIRHFQRKHPSAAFRMEDSAYVNSLLKPSTRPGIPTENVIIKTIKLNTPYQQFSDSALVNTVAMASNNNPHKGVRVAYAGAQPNFYSILRTIDRNHLVSASPDMDSDNVTTMPCTSDATIEEMETVVIVNGEQSIATAVPSSRVSNTQTRAVSFNELTENSLVNENVTAAEALHSLSHSADIQYQTESRVTNTVQMEDGTILDLDNLPADLTTADGSQVIIMQIVDDDGTEIMHVEDVAEQTVIE